MILYILLMFSTFDDYYYMIKFLNLKDINDSFEPELSQAIQACCLNAAGFYLARRLMHLKKTMQAISESKNCIGVANGLDALRLIFKAYIEMGIMKEGDEVIVPANTYIASILAITDNRLKPVLVEPDINTYNLDISLIEQHITPRHQGDNGCSSLWSGLLVSSA